MDDDTVQAKPLALSTTPLVQRQPEAEEEEEELQLKAEPAVLQRQGTEEEEELIQPKAAASTPVVTPSVQSGINASRGGGRPLSDGTRTSMESRFGRSFESVRVHDDRNAADLSNRLNAQAFTTGRDIFFGAGRYQPQSPEGGKLLAHELTHVVQQQPETIARKVSSRYSEIEDRLTYGPTDWAITDSNTAEVAGILDGLSKSDLIDTLGRMKSDKLLGRFLSNLSTADRTTYNSVFVEAWQKHVPPHPSLADKADVLGGNAIQMSSYLEFQGKRWKWFFSPNPTLTARASKPPKLDSWKDWTSLHWQSREVIANLAGLDANRIGEHKLSSLKAAYALWHTTFFAVFWQGIKVTNTCNIFLGDALFKDGRNKVRDGKYFTAQEVYDGKGAFVKIETGAAARGDIIANGVHVEIVTSVDHSKGEFCSRGGYRPPIGGELCGGSRRQISNWRFVRVG